MVGIFHVILANLGIMHRRLDVFMSQNPLYLLYRHPFIDGARCKCPPKFMRMHPVNLQTHTKFAQSDLNATNLQPIM